jgi:hypothetical protein
VTVKNITVENVNRSAFESRRELGKRRERERAEEARHRYALYTHLTSSAALLKMVGMVGEGDGGTAGGGLLEELHKAAWEGVGEMAAAVDAAVHGVALALFQALEPLPQTASTEAGGGVRGVSDDVLCSLWAETYVIAFLCNRLSHYAPSPWSPCHATEHPEFRMPEQRLGVSQLREGAGGGVDCGGRESSPWQSLGPGFGQDLKLGKDLKLGQDLKLLTVMTLQGGMRAKLVLNRCNV